MERITDKNYLKNIQYKTPINLQTRSNLHRRYGTNPYSWHCWVFDQLELQPGDRILEVGCGPGALWTNNQDRLPVDIQVVLTDFSIGMIGESRNILQADERFLYTCIDAQAISSKSNSFDLVIANHMLYHIPKIEAALLEFNRVLRPGGRLVSATNGVDHMHELHDLLHKLNPDYQARNTEMARFSLETAQELLNSYYESVDMRIYNDQLKVTDSEALLGYILSMTRNRDILDSGLLHTFEQYVQNTINTQGNFQITKSQGLFIAHK